MGATSPREEQGAVSYLRRDATPTGVPDAPSQAMILRRIAASLRGQDWVVVIEIVDAQRLAELIETEA